MVTKIFPNDFIDLISMAHHFALLSKSVSEWNEKISEKSLSGMSKLWFCPLNRHASFVWKQILRFIYSQSASFVHCRSHVVIIPILSDFFQDENCQSAPSPTGIWIWVKLRILIKASAHYHRLPFSHSDTFRRQKICSPTHICLGLLCRSLCRLPFPPAARRREIKDIWLCDAGINCSSFPFFTL